MVHDYTLALERYRAKADAGDSESQYRLGVMFGLGLGVAQDYAQYCYTARENVWFGDRRIPPEDERKFMRQPVFKPSLSDFPIHGIDTCGMNFYQYLVVVYGRLG